MMSKILSSNIDLNELIWTEKYRPANVSSCIIPEKVKTHIQSLIDSNQMTNMIFTGIQGSGKTSLALAICNELDYDVLMVNGSNEGRLIDTLRNKITNFAATLSVSGAKKCVILDEADYIPEETVQPALRNFIEEFSRIGVLFIMTCNNLDRIIAPLQSRCSIIDFTYDKKTALDLKAKMALRVKQILKDEGVKIESANIIPALVQKYFPDNRRLLNELQLNTANGTLDSSALSSVNQTDFDELVGYLKARNVKSAREWVALQSYIGVPELAKWLYNEMYNISNTKTMANYISILAEWCYKSSMMADKEIAMIAMLVDIMSQIEFKD